jgi:septal ring factor EnvC (AmiA/AmiB activator)
MGQYFLYAAIGLGIVFLILLIFAFAGKHEQLRKWLGPIGGLVIAIVAIFGISAASGGGGDLEKIKAENERIQKELDRLKSESEALNAQVAKQKAEYEAKLAALQSQLTQKEADRLALENQLKNTAQQDPLTWIKSLPEDEQRKIVKEINDGITWI